jgi:predicted NBD/HSP70 family sugar kinase
MRTIADQWLRDILMALYMRRSLTRTEVIESTGLNQASASHGLRFLLDRGVVLKVGEVPSNGAGRPSEILTLNGDAGYFVAVDLEGGSIRFALANFVGDIRCRWEEDLRFGEPLRVEQVVKGIQRVLRDLPPPRRSRVFAVGLSYPGNLDPDGQLIATNLGWTNVPLVAQLKRALHLPIFLEHDKHTCVLAERWLGALAHRPNGLFIIAERGIGVGICLDGKPVESWRNMTGELGHCKFDPAALDLCQCGQRGCLEAIASGPNIVRQYRERTSQDGAPKALRVTDVFERARQNDPAARAVVERAGKALGRAISNLIHLLNPEVVIFGGDLIAGEDVLLPVIREEVLRLSLRNIAGEVDLVVSSLGLDIRLRGAASLAFRNCLADPALLHRICNSVLDNGGSGRSRPRKAPHARTASGR